MTTPQTGFTGFNTAATANTAAPTLNFGAGGTGASGFSFGSTPASASPFNLNKTTTVSTSTGLSLGSLPSSTAGASTSFNFPTSTLTSQPQQSSLSFGNALNTSAAPAPNNKKVSFNLPTSSNPGATPVLSTSLIPSQPATITTGLTSNLQGMTFSELEENLNKWHIMIEEHQRLFCNKVNELNSTDTLLYENRIKLEKLNGLTDDATAKQKALNEELNFVGQQQKELDESVTSLEKQIEKIEADIPADTERTHIYKLADSLDLQIKKMNEELKEIIDSINEQNKSQDVTDPIVQIGKIINAQINTLTQLDQKVAVLNKDIETISSVQKKL